MKTILVLNPYDSASKTFEQAVTEAVIAVDETVSPYADDPEFVHRHKLGRLPCLVAMDDCCTLLEISDPDGLADFDEQLRAALSAHEAAHNAEKAESHLRQLETLLLRRLALQAAGIDTTDVQSQIDALVQRLAGLS